MKEVYNLCNIAEFCVMTHFDETNEVWFEVYMKHNWFDPEWKLPYNFGMVPQY